MYKQNPTDVAMYALKESNALVEEFMLLANITGIKFFIIFKSHYISLIFSRFFPKIPNSLFILLILYFIQSSRTLHLTDTYSLYKVQVDEYLHMNDCCPCSLLYSKKKKLCL